MQPSKSEQILGSEPSLGGTTTWLRAKWAWPCLSWCLPTVTDFHSSRFIGKLLWCLQHDFHYSIIVDLRLPYNRFSFQGQVHGSRACYWLLSIRPIVFREKWIIYKHCIKFESLSILLLYWWKIVKLCEFVKVDKLDFILFNKWN